MTRRRCAFALFTLAIAACTPTSGPTDAGPPDVGALPGTYANVAQILTVSCSFSSCHGGAGQGQARLNVQRSLMAGTLVADLSRSSCEYDAMPLLTPGDPMNSWLYIKSTGPHRGTDLAFTPAATWNHGGLTPDAMGRYPVSTCPLTSDGAITFGQPMPMGTGGVTPSQAETLRAWIAAGAPGP